MPDFLYMLKYLIYAGLILLSLDLFAQEEYTVTGEYQGRNIYVQNPLSPDQINFCTKEVYLNQKLILRSPKTSAFVIDLSGLKIGDPVFIKIVYSTGCSPKIINPQVIRSKSKFRFINESADAISLNWSTSGELPDGMFYVEHYVQKKWITMAKVPGKGSFENNQYVLRPEHHTGENKYRIRYQQNDGKIFFSKVFEYFNDVEPVSFYPTMVKDKITLSRETSYEIHDSKGNEILRGKAKEINLPTLKPGLYYLYIDNRKEKFVKE